MAFRFDRQPRWVLDTSAAVDPELTEFLESVFSRLSEIIEAGYHVGNEGSYLHKYDRPFILTPPCWAEIREAHAFLTVAHKDLAKSVKKARVVLEKLADKNMVTAEEWDDLSLGETRRERKLVCLKQVKDDLDAVKKEIVFLSLDPILLIRSAIAHINSCTVDAYLSGRVPKVPRQNWIVDDRARDTILIVDEVFLTSRDGKTLLSTLRLNRSGHPVWKIFLTKEVQKFAQSNQFSWQVHYPFTCKDLDTADISDWESRPKVCVVPTNHRALNDLKVEYHSILDEAVNFEQRYGSSIIGEPFDYPEKESLCLDQVSESARILIVTSDEEWGEAIRQKVVSCRSNLDPQLKTVEEVANLFGCRWEPRGSFDKPAADIARPAYQVGMEDNTDLVEYVGPPVVNWGRVDTGSTDEETGTTENYARKKMKLDPEIGAQDVFEVVKALTSGGSSISDFSGEKSLIEDAHRPYVIDEQHIDMSTPGSENVDTQFLQAK